MSDPAEVSLSAGKMIATGCRRHHGIPPFARVIHEDEADAVLLQTIDGDCFRLSVERIDVANFPPRSTSHD